MGRIAAILAVATGCGRIGFGVASDGASGDDAAQFDDAGHRIVSFGETGTATYSNVTADTFLDSSHTNFNYGAGAGVESQPSTIVGLMRFDLSALPPTQTVLAAKLIWFLQATDTGASVDLYRVTEPWTEGTVIGNPGAASWTQRMANIPWTTVGAGAPGSRESVSLAQFRPTSPGALSIPLDAAGVSVVEGWIANP